MFERAVGNLLSNVIYHSYANSTILVQVKEIGKQVTIPVSNQGDTISAQNLPYFFDRFYRADKSRQHLGSIGAGLGLSTTQSIVRVCNGKLDVNYKEQHKKFK